jgi:hypothetical protein
LILESPDERTRTFTSIKTVAAWKRDTFNEVYTPRPNNALTATGIAVQHPSIGTPSIGGAYNRFLQLDTDQQGKSAQSYSANDNPQTYASAIYRQDTPMRAMSQAGAP